MGSSVSVRRWLMPAYFWTYKHRLYWLADRVLELAMPIIDHDSADCDCDECRADRGR